MFLGGVGGGALASVVSFPSVPVVATGSVAAAFANGDGAGAERGVAAPGQTALRPSTAGESDASQALSPDATATGPGATGVVSGPVSGVAADGLLGSAGQAAGLSVLVGPTEQSGRVVIPGAVAFQPSRGPVPSTGTAGIDDDVPILGNAMNW